MMTLLLMKSRELDVTLDGVRVVTVGGGTVTRPYGRRCKTEFRQPQS